MQIAFYVILLRWFRNCSDIGLGYLNYGPPIATVVWQTSHSIINLVSRCCEFKIPFAQSTQSKFNNDSNFLCHTLICHFLCPKTPLQLFFPPSPSPFPSPRFQWRFFAVDFRSGFPAFLAKCRSFRDPFNFLLRNVPKEEVTVERKQPALSWYLRLQFAVFRAWKLESLHILKADF